MFTIGETDLFIVVTSQWGRAAFSKGVWNSVEILRCVFFLQGSQLGTRPVYSKVWSPQLSAKETTSRHNKIQQDWLICELGKIWEDGTSTECSVFRFVEVRRPMTGVGEIEREAAFFCFGSPISNSLRLLFAFGCGLCKRKHGCSSWSHHCIGLLAPFRFLVQVDLTCWAPYVKPSAL